MPPLALYSENNPFAAATLRNLIAAGQIAPGVVNERSIEDLTPDELRPYTQVHLFAGIGVWSAALRRAGWRDEWPIWTASCPCQPFSSAGARGGFDDERHLWPAVAWLADSVRPGLILGEQVSTGIGAEWLDCVQDDLERMGYAVGALAFPAAMLGVAHARLRTYWMADAECAGLPIPQPREFPDAQRPQERRAIGEPGGDGLGDSGRKRLEGRTGELPKQQSPKAGIGLEYADGARPFARSSAAETAGQRQTSQSTSRWTWARCTDGKARPFESGVLPVAHGLARNMGALDAGFRRLADMAGVDGRSLKRAQSYRVGAITAYGNALQLVQATEFCTWVRERYRG